MAFESTAVNELIAAVQQKQLQRDSSEWLYDARDEATEIDARMVDNPWLLPVHTAAPAAAAVPAAPAYSHIQRAELERAYGRMRSPTTHVHGLELWAVVKKLALPIAIISIVSVGFGVYFATTGAPANAGAIATAKPIEPEAAASTLAAAPVTDPAIENVKLEVSAEAVEVTPATATNDTAAEPQTTDTTESAASPPAAEPQTTETTETAVSPPADDPAPAPAASDEPVNVEPGSPASRFLAPPPVETTIPTVAEKPAPAPTVVAGLQPPADEPPAPALQASTRPAPQKAPQRDETSARGRRVRKDATAQRAKSVAAKPRAKRVAAADAPAASTGKGILSIASAPAMEVWVNGRNSKAMTPVRIKLRAGKHVVTLIDKQKGKSRSFPVVIKADETTTVTKRYE